MLALARRFGEQRQVLEQQAQFAAFVRDDVAANIALVKAAKIPTQ